MISTKSVIIFFVAMAMLYSYSASGGDSPDETKREADEAKQEAGEIKPESGTTPIYKLIVVMPPFFHGFAMDTISGAASDAPAKIANYVKQEKIDMGAIIRSEFDRQLQAIPELANRVKKDPTLKIYLKYRYGITKFAMSGYKPYLALGVAVIDASGKEAWKGTDYVGGLSGLSSTQSMEYSEYFSSPEKFRSAFEGAAKVVIQSLMKKISLPA